MITIIDDTTIFFDDFSSVIGTLNGIKTFRIIFDSRFSAIPLNLYKAEGLEITATCQSSDVIGVKHSDQLVIDGITFTVVGVHPIHDGKITRLLLEET